MPLRHAEQLRSVPFLVNFLNICRPGNQIEFARDKQHAVSVTQRLVVHRRAEMIMPRHERWLDARAAEFAPHKPCGRAFPDRVFDVYNRRHQRHETKIALDHREKRTDPSAVTRAEYAKLLAAALTQCCHQLPHFDHTLAKSLGVANKIGRDCKFAVPIAARDTRIVKWEVDEARIPAEFVKTRSTAAIPNVTRGHERVQHEKRRCIPAVWAWEEIRARDIVGRKICNDRAAPGNCWAGSIADCTCNFSAVWHGVKILSCELFARRHITCHVIATPRVQPMARLEQIYRRAHKQIDAARGETPELASSNPWSFRPMQSCWFLDG